MKTQHSAAAVMSIEATAGSRSDWRNFLLLAFVGLPVVMVGAIAAYGFVVWFLQLAFFGPPS